MKLFLPIFKMNFPEIVDLALPAEFSPNLQPARDGLRCCGLIASFTGQPRGSDAGHGCVARRGDGAAGFDARAALAEALQKKHGR